MKLLLVISLALATAGAAKELNPSDFPLTATVLSFEQHSSAQPIWTHDLNTGVVTGSGMSYASSDREEIRVGNIVYITSLLCRGGINGKVGDSFPARLGRKHRRKFSSCLGVISMASSGKCLLRSSE